MSEAQSSSEGRRRRDFSLTASVQNWSHNLPADHGKIFSVIFGAISDPMVKISTQQVILPSQQLNTWCRRDQKVTKFKRSKIQSGANGTPMVKSCTLTVNSCGSMVIYNFSYFYCRDGPNQPDALQPDAC